MPAKGASSRKPPVVAVMDRTMKINFAERLGLDPTDPAVAARSELNFAKRRTYQKIKDVMTEDLSECLTNAKGLDKAAYGLADAAVTFGEALPGDVPGLYYKNPELNEPLGLAELQVGPAEFIGMVDKAQDLLAPHVKAQLEAEYQLPPEDESFSSAVTFDERHNKLILGSARMARVMIPFVLNYVHKAKIIDHPPLLMDAVLGGLEKLTALYGGGVGILNKLFKLVENKIASTTYSDRGVWSYLPNIGLNPAEWCVIQYQRAITDILPKLEWNRNPIIFITSVVRNQNRYLFQSNIPINYAPLSRVRSEQDEINIFDREHAVVNHGEVEGAFGRLAVQEAMRRMEEEIGAKVEVEEALHYAKLIKPAREHGLMLTLHYHRHIPNRMVLLGAGVKEYYALFAYLIRFLQARRSKTLARLMVSNKAPASSGGPKVSKLVTKRFSNSKFVTSLENSHLYSNQIRSKFAATETMFDKADVFKQIFQAYMEGSREAVQFYDDRDEGVPEDKKWVMGDPKLVGQEIVDFLHNCVR